MTSDLSRDFMNAYVRLIFFKLSLHPRLVFCLHLSCPLPFRARRNVLHWADFASPHSIQSRGASNRCSFLKSAVHFAAWAAEIADVLIHLRSAARFRRPGRIPRLFDATPPSTISDVARQS